MKIEYTPKAKKHIETLTDTEREAAKYAIELIRSDEEHIRKCTREIEVFQNHRETEYRQAIIKQMDMQFRAKYFLDCFNLRAVIDSDSDTIKIKTHKEK